jgi:hypothetical protein
MKHNKNVPHGTSYKTVTNSYRLAQPIEIFGLMWYNIYNNMKGGASVWENS